MVYGYCKNKGYHFNQSIMNYADRFLYVPQIRVYDLYKDKNGSDEIFGDLAYVETFIMIKVIDVIGYQPDKGHNLPEHPDDMPYTLVHMKDGFSFIAAMRLPEFETLISEHYQKIHQ